MIYREKLFGKFHCPGIFDVNAELYTSFEIRTILLYIGQIYSNINWHASSLLLVRYIT